MLYSTKDIYIGRSLDLYGEFSEGEVHFFGQVLQPGMIAIDVGTNIGCHTVFMAKRVGPGGAVIAFRRTRAPASSITSIALSGKNLSEIYRSER